MKYILPNSDDNTTFVPFTITCAAHLQMLAFEPHQTFLSCDEPFDPLKPEAALALARVTAGHATRLTQDANMQEVSAQRGGECWYGDTQATEDELRYPLHDAPVVAKSAPDAEVWWSIHHDPERGFMVVAYLYDDPECAVHFFQVFDIRREPNAGKFVE